MAATTPSTQATADKLRFAAHICQAHPDVYVVGGLAVTAQVMAKLPNSFDQTTLRLPADIDLVKLDADAQGTAFLLPTWMPTNPCAEVHCTSGVEYSSPEYPFTVDVMLQKNNRTGDGIDNFAETLTVNLRLLTGSETDEVVTLSALLPSKLRSHYSDVLDDALDPAAMEPAAAQLQGAKIQAAADKLRVLKLLEDPKKRRAEALDGRPRRLRLHHEPPTFISTSLFF